MRRAPSLEFTSPSRLQQQGSTCKRGSTPTLRSVHSVSHTLDGLLPLLPCGPISSHYHVRDSPFRGLSPLPGRTVSSTARALLPLATISCRRVASTTPDPMAPPSGLSSEQRSVATDRVFSPDDARSPPRFSLPRVFLRTPWPSLRSPSAHDLRCQTLRVTLATGLQRFNRCPAWPPIPRRPSRSSFPACPPPPPK